MNEPATKQATYADLVALPENVVGEILGGELYAQPRPTPRHATASSELGGVIVGEFSFRSGGRGGWRILDESELHLGGDVIVPDLAGWRLPKLETLPDTAYIETSPDWVCEVLSPLDLPPYRGHIPPFLLVEVSVAAGEDHPLPDISSGR